MMDGGYLKKFSLLDGSGSRGQNLQSSILKVDMYDFFSCLGFFRQTFLGSIASRVGSVLSDEDLLNAYVLIRTAFCEILGVPPTHHLASAVVRRRNNRQRSRRL